MDRPRIIISGGGTGGHIFPAISIANAIKELCPEAEILFVGAKGKMEMEKVPAAGYRIVGLPVAGLQRKLTLKNLSLPFKVIGSICKAGNVIKEFKPDLVIGVGGYASAPVLWTASHRGIPCLIQEQNSFAGVTNKLLAQRANRICVAYEGMKKFFPADKIMMTGNPVRQNLTGNAVSRNEAAELMGLDPAKRIILVIGGRLGARSLNESIMSQLDAIRAAEDVQIYWQTGKLYIDEMRKRLAAENEPVTNLFPTDFVTRMDCAYSAADLVISRAGAGSISELCLLGKPVILVPSPNVAEDHQTKNAMALVNKDAAIHIADADAGKSLVPEAIRLVRDSERLKVLGKNALSLALPDSAEIIAREVLKLADKN